MSIAFMKNNAYLIPSTMAAAIASMILLSVTPSIHARGTDDHPSSGDVRDDHGRGRGADDPAGDDRGGREISGGTRHDPNDDDVGPGRDDPANHDLGDDRRSGADDAPNHERQDPPETVNRRGGKGGRDDRPKHS